MGDPVRGEPRDVSQLPGSSTQEDRCDVPSVGSGRIALTLPGIEAGVWQVRQRTDRAAVGLANRHYSRETPNERQVAGPRPNLVLVTPCERAAWISEYNLPTAGPGRGTADGLNAWRCTLFRNEGAGVSSDLIREAMRITDALWRPRFGIPTDGWVTWVDRTKVASQNPGYCFKRAGWLRDREWSHPRLVRLRASGSADLDILPTRV